MGSLVVALMPTCTTLAQCGSAVFLGSHHHEIDRPNIADVTGDGINDVLFIGRAVATDTSYCVLLRNHGAAFFAICDTLVAAPGVEHLLTADLNGDGTEELLYVQQDTSIRIAYMSSGTIDSIMVMGTVDPVVGIAVGDVNNDGLTDVIAGTYQSSSHLVKFTNMGGGLLEDSTYFVGYSLNNADLYLEDLDGDTLDDLVVSRSGITFSVLNNGIGRFPTLTDQNELWRGKPCDLNHDGIIDLMAPDVWHLAVVFGTGDGHFTDVTGFSVGLATSASVRDVVVSDINASGIMDLSINYTEDFDTKYRVLLDIDSMSYAVQYDLPGYLGENGPEVPHVLAGEVDGNPGDEVFAFRASTPLFAHWLNNTGTFSPIAYHLVDHKRQYEQGGLADITGDGLAELLCSQTGKLYAIEPQDPSYTAFRRYHFGNQPIDGQYPGGAMIPLDYDQDGVMDILGTRALLLNEGGGTFTEHFFPDQDLYTKAHVLLIDVNGDGWEDMYPLSFTWSYLFLNSAGDTAIKDMYVGPCMEADTLDMDADGDMDIVSLAPQYGTMFLRENTGGELASSLPVAYFDAPAFSLATVAMDTIPLPDIAVLDSAGVLHTFLNAAEGDADVGTSIPVLFGASPEAMERIQLNGDALDDLVILAEKPFGIQPLLNMGNGQWQVLPTLWLPDSLYGRMYDQPDGEYFSHVNLCVGDIEGDGLPDVLFPSYRGLWLLKNYAPPMLLLADTTIEICSNSPPISATDLYPFYSAHDPNGYLVNDTLFAGSLGPGTYIINNVSNGPGICGTDTADVSVTVLDCGIGIDELRSAHPRIFPNPASSGFHLSDLTGSQMSGEWQMIRVTGDIVARGQLRQGWGDVSSVAPGAYFLRLNGNACGTIILYR